MEHKLQYKWVFWHQDAANNANWEETLKVVASVKTVERFWKTYNLFYEISRYPPNHIFHFFKNGIKPSWEDVNNKNGERWCIETNPKEANQIWLDLLLAMIGEQFESEHNTGLTLSRKKNTSKIFIWTSTIDPNFKQEIQAIIDSKYNILLVPHIK